MKAILIFLLIPVAMFMHTVFATKLGVYSKWPVGALSVMVVALGMLAWLLVKAGWNPPKFGLIAINVLAWGAVGVFLWWTQVYSSYAKMEAPSQAAGTLLSKLQGVAVHDEKLEKRGSSESAQVVQGDVVCVLSWCVVTVLHWRAGTAPRKVREFDKTGSFSDRGLRGFCGRRCESEAEIRS